jgi:hypothetical protein
MILNYWVSWVNTQKAMILNHWISWVNTQKAMILNYWVSWINTESHDYERTPLNNTHLWFCGAPAV